MLGVGILLIAFPKAHGVVLGALYLPVALMLVGPDPARRGVRLPRQGARRATSATWNRLFFAGSPLAVVAQGWMLGRYITGFGTRLELPAVRRRPSRSRCRRPTCCSARAG